jgi:PhzF family phenazine biosynthesis protein
MSQTIYQVDAFTRRPFSGNPAAICILNTEAAPEWMLAVAGEMNLSETAYLVRQQEGFGLRWFTPKREVRLCGHATLAAAHILWEQGVLAAGETACFDTLSGQITANLRGSWVEMDFPARFHQPAEALPGLTEALGVSPTAIHQRENIYLLEVASEEAVRGLQPDFSALARLPVRSVIVTARSASADFDFVSRYFAPAVGINEDPVTGSAHCALAVYWSQRLGKTEMTAYQASARGGVVGVRLNGERVILRGQAVTVLVGDLSV